MSGELNPNGTVGQRLQAVAIGKSSEVAGLRTLGLKYREGSQFCLLARGPALAEVSVNGAFALMYRRKDSRGDPDKRMFFVTNSDYEIREMSHGELLAELNRLAEMAD